MMSHMSPDAMGGMGPMHMEAMPPEAMAGMPPGYEAIDPMTGNAPLPPDDGGAWGDGADTGGGLDGLAPVGDMAAPMDPLGDAMAGPADPMAGADPMGGAPAFDGAMAALATEVQACERRLSESWLIEQQAEERVAVVRHDTSNLGSASSQRASG